jgi:hypothetical protein
MIKLTAEVGGVGGPGAMNTTVLADALLATIGSFTTSASVFDTLSRPMIEHIPW